MDTRYVYNTLNINFVTILNKRLQLFVNYKRKKYQVLINKSFLLVFFKLINLNLQFLLPLTIKLQQR